MTSLPGPVNIVVTLSGQAQSVFQEVCRYMELSSDALTAPTASELFETLLMEKAIEAASQSNPPEDTLDTAAAMDKILDPNISVGVELTSANSSMDFEEAPVGYGTAFDLLAAMNPHDQWIKQVVETKEDTELWERALVTVYRAVFGADRKDWQTWILIERTYRLLKSQNAGG